MPKFTQKMVALKPMTYNHRKLEAGDEFDALHRAHAFALQKAKKARHGRLQASLAPPSPGLSRRLRPTIQTDQNPQDRPEEPSDQVPAPEPAPEPQPDVAAPQPAAPVDDIIGLRKQYFEKLGKRAYPRWGVDELRAKLAEVDDSSTQDEDANDAAEPETATETDADQSVS